MLFRSGVRPFIYLNPLTYLIESFRYALLGTRFLPLWTDAAFLLISAVGAAVAGSFFQRLSPVFADHE